MADFRLYPQGGKININGHCMNKVYSSGQIL